MRKLSLMLVVCLLFGLLVLPLSALAQETITFAVFPGFEQAYYTLAEAYKEKTGVEVRIHVLPRVGYREALIGPLTSGSEEYDVIYIQNPWLAEFVEAGFVAPLDDYLTTEELKAAKNDIFPAGWDMGTYSGKLWGLPWDYSTFLLFYRTDLMEKPPQTMQEYLEVARKFTRSLNPDSPTKYGTVLEGSPERVNTQEWYNILWSFGGDLFDENMSPTFNSPEAVKALEYYYGTDGIHGTVPPDVNNYRYPEVLTAFQEELVPMVLQWNAAYASFADPKQSPKIHDRFDMTVVPAYETEDGTLRRVPFAKAWYAVINSASRNKQAAADWIYYFTGPEAGKISLLNGGLSSSTGAWSDPEVLGVRKDASVFMESSTLAKMTPNLPEFTAMEDHLIEALTFVLAGRKGAEQALTDANEAALKVLERAQRSR